MCDAISETSSIPRSVCGPGPTSGQSKILEAGLTGKEPPSVCWVALLLCTCVCVCVLCLIMYFYAFQGLQVIPIVPVPLPKSILKLTLLVRTSIIVLDGFDAVHVYV